MTGSKAAGRILSSSTPVQQHYDTKRCRRRDWLRRLLTRPGRAAIIPHACKHIPTGSIQPRDLQSERGSYSPLSWAFPAEFPIRVSHWVTNTPGLLIQEHANGIIFELCGILLASWICSPFLSLYSTAAVRQ